MARRVFFSFHYDDVTRVNIVRNSNKFTRQYEGVSRFHDASLWEEAKRQGDASIKRLIDGGLKNTSVTCVLIGQETWRRPWVRYEIIKSFSRGNGLFGIRIHDVGFDPKEKRVAAMAQALAARRGLLPHANTIPQFPLSRGLMAPPPPPPPQPPPPPGQNPFNYLGFWVQPSMWGDYNIQEIGSHGQWQQFDKHPYIPKNDISWLIGLTEGHNLSEFFPVYNWDKSAGSGQIEEWVESAATRAGRY